MTGRFITNKDGRVDNVILDSHADKEQSNTPSMEGKDMAAPEQPCRGCGKPMLIDNAWMEDGCPCNTPAGVNNLNLYRWRLLHELQQREARANEKLKRELFELHEEWQQDLKDAAGIVSSAARKIDPHYAAATDPAAEYARRNPLGGPATVFEAIAARLRYGEDYYAVLDDFNLQVKGEGPSSASTAHIELLAIHEAVMNPQEAKPADSDTFTVKMVKEFIARATSPEGAEQQPRIKIGPCQFTNEPCPHPKKCWFETGCPHQPPEELCSGPNCEP